MKFPYIKKLFAACQLCSIFNILLMKDQSYFIMLEIRIFCSNARLDILKQLSTLYIV